MNKKSLVEGRLQVQDAFLWVSEVVSVVLFFLSLGGIIPKEFIIFSVAFLIMCILWYSFCQYTIIKDNCDIILGEENNKEEKELEEDLEMNVTNEFCEGKLSFFICNGNVLMYMSTDKTHEELAKNNKYLSKIWKELVRGYIIDGRIQFYTGDFERACMSDVSVDNINFLVASHNTKFHSETITLYNGVIKGEIGTLWEPELELFTICCKTK